MQLAAAGHDVTALDRSESRLARLSDNLDAHRASGGNRRRRRARMGRRTRRSTPCCSTRPAPRPAPSAAIPKCSTAPGPRSSSRAPSFRNGCSPAPPTGSARAEAWSTPSAASSRRKARSGSMRSSPSGATIGWNLRPTLVDGVTPASARLAPRPARHARGGRRARRLLHRAPCPKRRLSPANRPHGPPAHLPVDPVRRFRQAGRGGARDRRGRAPTGSTST